MSSTYLIKHVDDIVKCPQYGFEHKGKAISIHAVVDGKKLPLKISLGSKSENSGLEVEKTPDEVKVTLGGSGWEKEKLILQLKRDSDIKVMHFLNTIARRLYDAAKGDLDENEWYDVLSGNGTTIKVKVHPTQTLYSSDAVEWKHIGTGENYTKPASKKRKRTPEPEKKERKDKKKRRQSTDPANAIDTSELLPLADTPGSHALDTKDLLQGVSSTAKHHHYKVYEGDQICTTVDVGDIWCMRINGKDSCGITLKAKHMVILSRVGGQETEQVEEVQEEEVPGMDVFA
jgi:hypothetical protein